MADSGLLVIYTAAALDRCRARRSRASGRSPMRQEANFRSRPHCGRQSGLWRIRVERLGVSAIYHVRPEPDAFWLVTD